MVDNVKQISVVLFTPLYRTDELHIEHTNNIAYVERLHYAVDVIDCFYRILMQ